ncbi:MAG: 30S ribosome-binding factor RbfA [Nitrospirae bacterium]|uniref:30S ribosome-binding factor RbfA n=1 Tax=Candidatus Magnetobacterium casense TaxID=1455061 RepID=UPI00058C7C42|nr:30S ribosome-binding factor RbfA [Candidatus Magnetobacterium casensis]MBF0337828.1 30S ribosome-binding factor RbfA [Nitrospirota bacterium]
MLPYRRSQRVGDLLRREVSDIILTRVKDPRIGFVTVTDVELTDDLKVARVYISVLNSDQLEHTLKVLRRATGFIRHELAMSVDLRRVPALEFLGDRSIEYGSKIDGILRQIKEEEG